jgi:RNA polymerase sigma factor (sigma-70 family)
VSKQALNGVFAHIRRLAGVQTARRCLDRELLDRFVEAHDEAAFTVLVERHGPVVLGLCRRVLRHTQDADDACQATFLVLARKAATLRKRISLASWLHGVAYRTSVNLRRAQARRLRREQRAEPKRNHHIDEDVSWRELHAILDEELERLPERYRAPLILCYLDGKTRDEAARDLGTTPGALHGLLERGRTLLRRRLTGRGVTLPAALVVTALSTAPAKAALAAPAVIACTKAALALAGGRPLAEGLIAPHVLSLAQEVMKVMFFTKVKIGTAILACAGLLALLTTGSLGSVSLAQERAKDQAAGAVDSSSSAKIESDDDFIRRVSKDLRGTEPTPAEMHFFRATKDANKRQKLIDLFIQERQAKQAVARRTLTTADALAVWVTRDVERVHLARPQALWIQYARVRPASISTLQEEYYKQILAAAKEKKDVANITQGYLDRLLDYVKSHPKAEDVADAMLHISLVYRSQGKTVEADAWRDKLRKEHPQSRAAQMVQQGANDALWLVPESSRVDLIDYIVAPAKKEPREKNP